jgi:GPI biosynthesis protein family Pig-F
MSPTSLSSILPTPPKTEVKGPRLLTPTTNAIPLISTRNGWNYSIIHTVAVVTLFVLQFRALVADPYQVMILDLVPLMLLQCAYGVSCLPPTGTWSNTTNTSGNEAAGNVSAKTNKGSGTGSLRKRPAGLGRAGASPSGGWKGKLVVYPWSLRAEQTKKTNLWRALAYSYCTRLDSAPPTDPIDSPRTCTWRTLVPNSAHFQYRHTITTHLAPYLFSSVLYTRSVRARMA